MIIVRRWTTVLPDSILGLGLGPALPKQTNISSIGNPPMYQAKRVISQHQPWSTKKIGKFVK